MIGNLLYIGNNIRKIQTGGDAVNVRNFSLLKTLLEEKFYHYEIKENSGRFNTFINLINRNIGGIHNNDYHQIVEAVKRYNINSVFLWSSKLGKLAKFLKANIPEIKIITFLHNIEKQYNSEELKLNHSIKNRFISAIVNYNEALAIKKSDILITLNNRDTSLMKSLYGVQSSFELPISFEDHYNAEKANILYTSKSTHPFKLLFIGSNFFANNNGMNWFLTEVMPYLTDVELTIAGKGMSSVFKESVNIKVYDFVEDLSELYYSTDVVIAPIFYGGGMKTKTAEALMYGCPIVGTKESFEGYDLDYSKIGGIAQTPNDMIDLINRLKNQPSLIDNRRYAREVFLRKYCIDSSIEILKDHLLKA